MKGTRMRVDYLDLSQDVSCQSLAQCDNDPTGMTATQPELDEEQSVRTRVHLCNNGQLLTSTNPKATTGAATSQYITPRAY